jgi:16S rRNA processing protein RimM
LKDKIAIGKILTAHGIKGFVKVKSLSGETDHFEELKEVYIHNGNSVNCLNIEKIKIADRIILIKFKNIDTPEKAKSLNNVFLWTDRKNACKLKRDEYYLQDICSCSVFLREKKIGEVKSSFESANTDNLEILLNDKTIAIIPFLSRFIEAVNIKEKQIYIKEDCGLI